ncbi:MAG: NTP transferase domain-containing protein [Acidimicrobiales bacterium]
MPAAAVILAAGGGDRFNAANPDALPGAKLLVVVRGRPLVAWALAPALEAGFDEVVVVDGAADLRGVVPESVTVVRNGDWRRGQASSLRVGLDWCEQRGHTRAVIGLGDLPGLTAAAWRAVRTAPAGPVVFATYAGRRGHPVRLDAEVWPLLPATGEEGARVLAREHPELVHEVACAGEAADVDTPEDLRRWT